MREQVVDKEASKADDTALPQPESEDSVTSSTPKSDADSCKPGFGNVLLSTFLTIFLAEIGDKTQIATLLMSAESQSPWIVFSGAAAALICTTLIGVALGSWLAKRVSPRIIDRAAAIMLLSISLLLIWDVVRS